MGKMQRTKGQVGEREAAALISEFTGWLVSRRVRNSLGDSDLVGAPGWSIEIKRYASGSKCDIERWWNQCLAQSGQDKPVLFYRFNRSEWRAVWLLHEEKRDYVWTIEASIEAWGYFANAGRV